MKHRLIGASCFAIILAGCSSTPQQTSSTDPAQLLTFSSERVYYTVPQVTEEIIVTATIDPNSDTITDVSAEHVAHHHKSERYMLWFDQGIADAVVGKKIDNAQVAVINGASDTSHGFNEAILDIQQQYENTK